MGLIFYDYALAYFPARARLTIIEKQQVFQHIQINLLNADCLKPDFMRLNPKGTLPVLVDGDTIICESAAICDYINSIGGPLGAAVDQGAVKTWTDSIKDWDGNCYMANHTPASAASIIGALKCFKLKVCEVRAKEFPDLKAVYETKITGLQHEYSKEETEQVESELVMILNKSDEQLLKSSFLAGEEYTLADVFLTTLVYRLSSAGTQSKELEARPNLNEWYTRMKSRPSFGKTFHTGSLQKYPVTAILPSIGPLLVGKLFGRY